MGIVDVDVGSVVGKLGEALDGLFTSAEEKAAADLVLRKLEQEPQRWQALINMTEAKHASTFVAGWRPFIGWVCGAALAWQFLLASFFGWLSAIFAGPPPPDLVGTGELIPLVIALLGLGGLRTFEKAQGVAK